MRRVVTAVLARYDDEQLEFLDRALGELCEAGRGVIASMGHEGKGDERARKRGRAR
jgi:hypothetical protein